MSSLPCVAGCTCGRHRPGSTVVYRRTFAHRIAARSKERPDTTSRNREPRSILTKLRASNSLVEYWEAHPNERHGSGGRRRTSGNFGFSGAETGDLFASILCPVGYIREHVIQYAPGRYNHYKVDFAHPEARVAVELDGPYHQATEEEDVCRDAKLRELGWKVIRIQHD